MGDPNTAAPIVGPQHGPTPPLPENSSHGTSSSAEGMSGESNFGPGVSGRSVVFGGGTPPGPVEAFAGGKSDGVLGTSAGNGVHGVGGGYGSGVLGENTGGGPGVAGTSSGVGVSGTSTNGDGVFGTGPHNGVHGRSASAGDSGVYGENTGSGAGVSGASVSGTGVIGQGGWNGVQGSTANSSASGVWGENTASGYGVGGKSAGGIGVYGTGSPAGHFDGDVEVTGDIRLMNQDCAEDFEMAGIEHVLPGSVVVIDSKGALKQSDRAYDTRVAGVISGAGDCKPGIILGSLRGQARRLPVALVGKVYCKVDADYSPVEVGDLLTTSATPGHAMKAADHVKAFGAVVGKALSPLETGQRLIPILVALQ